MDYEITLYEDIDDYGETTGQELYSETDDKLQYGVYNLNECPEDAIIDRGLFTAYDYINAVEFGMELAQRGYTQIKVKYDKDNGDC